MGKQQGYYCLLVFAVLVLIVNRASASWEQTSGPGAGDIHALAVSGSTVFAGLNGGGIFRSTDNGENWVAADSGMSAKEVINALAIIDSTILAGTNTGLFISTNNGGKWVQSTSALVKKRLNCLLVMGKNILAGSEFSGVLLSTNNGASWTSGTAGMADSSIVSLAVNGSTIFAGTKNAIYRSTNNGKNWTNVNSHSGMCFKAIVACGSTILAGTSPISSEGSLGIIRSTDGGAKWVTAEPGLKYKNINFLSTIGTTVYAATWNEGVYQSTDYGKNWQPDSTGLTCGEVNVFALNGTTIFAGTDGGVFRSAGAAAKWTMASSGITKVRVTTLMTSGNTVYAGTEKDGVFYSTDNGTRWTQVVSGLTRDRIYSLAVNGPTVFAGTDSMGVFRLADISAGWSAVGSTIIKNVPIFDMSAIGPAVFAKSTSAVFRSTDNGERWAAAGPGFPRGAGLSFALKNNALFTGADSGVFRSTDNGTSWTAADSGLADKKILSLAALDNALFAGTYLNGVYLSTDNGAIWTKSTMEWSFSIDELVTAGGTIFGMSSTSIFLSTDSGKKWTSVHAGIGPAQFASLAVNNDMLFAGTLSDGIWRRPLSEIITGINTVQQKKMSKAGFTLLAPGTNNPHTTIAFSLPDPERVSITIFSISGKKIASLVDRNLGPGPYEYRWNTMNVAPGCYTIMMQSGHNILSKSVPVMR